MEKGNDVLFIFQVSFLKRRTAEAERRVKAIAAFLFRVGRATVPVALALLIFSRFII